MNLHAPRTSCTAALRRLTEQVLEAPDLETLARLLARALPAVLGVSSATVLLWDRKLERFEALTPGETHTRPVRPEGPAVEAPEARFLISEGRLIETPGRRGEGTLLPLMARAGLAGMLVLGRRRGRRKLPYRPAETRRLSALAARAALQIENHLYQRELIASERMAALGSLAGLLAHDLRGPMTVIRGYAETLLEGGFTREELEGRARTIVEMIDRLERMTGETLDFARGGGRLALRTVDAGPTLESLARSIGLELPGLEVVFEARLPGPTPIELDVDKLRRALANIAGNALEAMGGAGRLRLEARLERSADQARAALVLTLADEGPGVPAAIRERLFEPFVTHGKKSGTGLGLVVARRFVEDHGGTLELSPEGPGARFRLELPLKPL